MIEILVTITIIAIALLGIAGLQANSLRFLKVANQRSEASQAAYDMSERMRANRVAVSTGDYTYSNHSPSDAGTYPALPANCAGLTCTPTELAIRDLAEMQQGLSARLNHGSAYIVRSGVGWDITILWKEIGFNDVDPACPAGVSSGSGVRCFTLRFIP